MTKKEITIAGKQVTLAYCYATEIGYTKLADEKIEDFFLSALEMLTANKMPDLQKSFYLILASALSYYEAQGEESPLTDKDLMYFISPEEIGVALGTIISLRAEFYNIPLTEPKNEEADEKNA